MSSETAESKPSYGYGMRHVQTFLLFFYMFVAYSMRVNLSVAIVAMVDSESTNPDFPEYDWKQSTQSLILSSFFWGYGIGQIPAGPLAQKFGAKIICLLTLAVCSVLTILTPLAAKVGGWELVCAVRVLIGLMQSFAFPCTHTLLANWIPVTERARLAAFVYAGGPLGTVVMLAVSGAIAASVMGWPSIYYVSGALGLLWTVLWFFFSDNSPNDSKWIKDGELNFINASIGSNKVADSGSKAIPWRHIFTSVPFFALLFTQCCQNWGFWTLLTKIPTYMKAVLEMDIKSNALLSALPYFVLWVLSIIFSLVADFLTNRSIVSPGVNRKIFNSIGFWGPAVMLLGLGYFTKEQSAAAVAILTMAVGMNAGTYVGFLINHMDLSPNYAGTLMGLTNFTANLVSIIAPIIVGVIVGDEDESNITKWRIVFFITAGIYGIGNLAFVLFAQGEIQPWNNYQKNDAVNAIEENTSDEKQEKVKPL